MQGQKFRLSFFAYNNGKEVHFTTKADFVNSISEAEEKAKAFVEAEYPGASDLNVVFNNKFMVYGGWVVAGVSRTDPDMAFLLVINKL